MRLPPRRACLTIAATIAVILLAVDGFDAIEGWANLPDVVHDLAALLAILWAVAGLRREIDDVVATRRRVDQMLYGNRPGRVIGLHNINEEGPLRRRAGGQAR